MTRYYSTKSSQLSRARKTPGAAALALNKQLFPAVGVKYSTARQRPDQCVSMSLASGLASCSGLSILLVNACRAAGVPARVVGTPMWSNERGNHTWVEVWDKGDWHYIGAAEPDDKGYDHGWFEGDAAKAKDDGLHAIYATSWKQTGTHFPLVWDDNLNWVSAQNVDDALRQRRPAAAFADAFANRRCRPR